MPPNGSPDPASTLHATRRLLALRRAHPALRLGDLQALVTEGDVLVIAQDQIEIDEMVQKAGVVASAVDAEALAEASSTKRADDAAWSLRHAIDTVLATP